MIVLLILNFLLLYSLPIARIPILTPFFNFTVDDIIAILFLCSLVIFRLYDSKNRFSFPKNLTFALLGFFSMGFVSVAYSPILTFSLTEWLSYFAYAGILFFCFFPQVTHSNISMVAPRNNITLFFSYKHTAQILKVLTIIYSSIIITLYVYHTSPEITGSGWLQGRRFIIHPIFGSWVDILFPQYVSPNAISAGLIIGVSIAISTFSFTRKNKIKLIFNIFSIIAPLIAILLLASRSSIIALTASLLITYPDLLKLYTSLSQNIKKIVRMLIIITLALFVFGFFIFFEPIWFNRLFSIAESLTNNSNYGRVQLIFDSLTRIVQSPINFIFGRGFMISNPHNEYLRHFEGSGIIGLVLFINVFYVIYKIAFQNSIINKQTVSRKILFWSIVISINFTPLTKILWIAMLFVLLPVYETNGIAYNSISNLKKYKLWNKLK